MKRTGYLAVSVSLMLVFALCGFGQARQPAPKSAAEYNAYMDVYNEKDAPKKAAFGEKFLVDFQNSDFIPNSHRMIIGAYSQSQNWTKVMEAADRAAASAGADDTMKAFAYGNAMVAAQNSNNTDKVISYGDKVLAIAPNDLDTMMVVSSTIPTKLPTNAAEKKAALDKAASLASKALALLQPVIASAPANQKAALVQAEGQLHATLGIVAYNRPDYPKAIEEYEAATKANPKDDVAHYYLGAAQSALQSQAVKDYTTAVKAENDAKRDKAEQPMIDELAARRTGLEDEVKKFRDKAIDEFGIAAAIGGPVASQAKTELAKLWTAKNDSTNGMDAFINSKK